MITVDAQPIEMKTVRLTGKLVVANLIPNDKSSGAVRSSR